MEMHRKKRAKFVQRDEPFLTQEDDGQPRQEDEVMVKDDFVILTSREAKRKSPLPSRPDAPASSAPPVPDAEEIIASEDELPEPIDESEISDMDVPEEEQDFEEVEVKEEAPAPKPYTPVFAPGPSPMPQYRRGAHRSPAHEQVSGMPFLSQGIEGGASGVGGIILLLAGLAAVGGIIYYLKRNS